MQVKLIKTKDGSSSLYVPSLDENYHSVNGAVQESMHVFIHAGLLAINKKKLTIFEMGFGTGLNCLLSLLYKKDEQHISYNTIELHPLDTEIVKQLNYPQALSLGSAHSKVFEDMHAAPWGTQAALADSFTFRKTQSDIQSYHFEPGIDLVYFDAFGPDFVPEQWDEKIFAKIHAAMNAGGILVTYCAKGIIRRRLQAVGFSVERLPGPPGKREMLRATKSNEQD